MLLYYFIIRKSFKKLHNPTTFIIFAPMKRKIRTYGGYFEAFMETLKEKEQEKNTIRPPVVEVPRSTA